MTSKLRNLISKRTHHHGKFHGSISDSELAKLKLDEELTNLILESFDSQKDSQLTAALWAINGIFTTEYPETGSLRKEFLTHVLNLCSHPEGYIRAKAIKTLRVFNNDIKDYRKIMLKALKDPYPAVRWEALHAYPIYAKEGETKPLEEFSNDPYRIELGKALGNMEGSYRYILRELAEQILEKMRD